MRGRIALILVVAVGVVGIPAMFASAAISRPVLARDIRLVDQHLDRVLRQLRAAEQLADAKGMSRMDTSVDHALRLMRAAELKVDRALSIVRGTEAGKLTKAQMEEIERLSAGARGELRSAEAILDRVALRTVEFRKLRDYFADADRQVDQALSMLHRIIVSL